VRRLTNAADRCLGDMMAVVVDDIVVDDILVPRVGVMLMDETVAAAVAVHVVVAVAVAGGKKPKTMAFEGLVVAVVHLVHVLLML
jgi:hypothetical protein